MKINIQIYGEGLPLVLFHGWGFDSHIWHSLIPSLIDSYQLHLIDLPGFGLSPYMQWDDFKDQILQQLPKYFALIGWSMGGLYATRLAIEAPQRVSHLLNIASSPRFISDDDWPGVEKHIFTTFYNNLIREPEQVLKEFILLQLKGKMPDILSAKAPSLEGLSAGLNLLMDWDLRQGLSDLAQPVCYLFGRLDAITPYAILEKMKNLYPKFNYNLFRKAAHAPFLSHPHDFIDLLEGFLS